MESLNFEDEISLKGVECNIPLVSYQNITSRTYQRLSVQEFVHDEECFIIKCMLNARLVISVRLRTCKAKRKMVKSHKGHFSFILQALSLSRIRNQNLLSPLSSKSPLPLFSSIYSFHDKIVSMHIRLKHEVYSWSQNQILEFGFHDGKSELEVMLACCQLM